MTMLPPPCSIEWCVKPARLAGLCGAHYQRRSRGTDMNKPFRNGPGAIKKKCAVHKCDATADCAVEGAVCASHRNIYRTRGTYNRIRLRHEGTDRLCSIYLCEARAKSRTMCLNHTTKASTYKLTAIQIDMIVRRGICELCCEKSDKLHIDHDHSCCSGATSCGNCVRGALCPGCNLGLGAFRDDVNKFERAIKYLQAI